MPDLEIGSEQFTGDRHPHERGESPVTLLRDGPRHSAGRRELGWSRPARLNRHPAKVCRHATRYAL